MKARARVIISNFRRWGKAWNLVMPRQRNSAVDNIGFNRRNDDVIGRDGHWAILPFEMRRYAYYRHTKACRHDFLRVARKAAYVVMFVSESFTLFSRRASGNIASRPKFDAHVSHVIDAIYRNARPYGIAVAKRLYSWNIRKIFANQASQSLLTYFACAR